MIRIVCDRDQRVGDLLTLTQDQTHYLERVMRQKPGDVIEIHLGDEGLYQATLLGSGKVQLNRTPTSVRAALPSRIFLYQALLKQDHFAEVVERGTEAGISEFIPIVTDRSIVREVTPHRDQRWRKIATEATEQCRGAEVPRIRPMATVTSIRPPEGGLGLLLDPAGAPLSAIIENRPLDVALVVGPEGGFTEPERSLLGERGFVAVSLGPHVFRAENAGSFAAVMLQALWSR